MGTFKNQKSLDIELYHYWRSSCSWRVRWGLKHKGILYQDKIVNLLKDEQKSPEFVAMNPSGFLPALRVNGTVFGESLAILEWIEETFPEKPLLPNCAFDKLRVRQFCQMIASGIQPIQNLSVMRHHSSDFVEQQKWAKHWIETGLVKVEKAVLPYAGSHCFGGQLTLADLCLIPQLYNAQRFGLRLEMFPTLKRVYEHCMTLPSCIAAAPENQPGAQ